MEIFNRRVSTDDLLVIDVNDGPALVVVVVAAAELGVCTDDEAEEDDEDLKKLSTPRSTR